MKYCSSLADLHVELDRIKQLLINNGYTNTEVDAEIRRHLSRSRHERRDENTKNTIRLYYHNHMSPAHKVDERIMNEIISDGVTCTDPKDRVTLQIYLKKIERLTIWS